MLVLPAFAGRPDTDTGTYTYDSADVLTSVDGPSGRVRVHYSESGPNVSILDDEDGSGAPDYPEQVAAVAEDVLVFYEAMGFRSPLTEAEVELPDLGGSAAFDVYLIDLSDGAEGLFNIDDCTDSGTRCAGHMLIENDLQGSAYRPLEEVTAVLVSHELFHAVQAAYRVGQPDWMYEGMAVWAEFQYQPGADSFFRACSEYLIDSDQGLASPTPDDVSGFPHGTALFFQFLTEWIGDGVGPAIQEAMYHRAGGEALDAVQETIKLFIRGDIGDAWPVFARWNLATGDRAGDATSYPFAAALGGVSAKVSDVGVVYDDTRIHPLSTTYYQLQHTGGGVQLSEMGDLIGLVISFHSTTGEGAATQIGELLKIWSYGSPLLSSTADSPGWEIGEFEAGEYWLVVSYPEPADQSLKFEFCLGEPWRVESCWGGYSLDTGRGPADDGCGCRSTPGLPWLLGLAGLAPLWARQSVRPLQGKRGPMIGA